MSVKRNKYRRVLPAPSSGHPKVLAPCSFILDEWIPLHSTLSPQSLVLNLTLKTLLKFPRFLYEVPTNTMLVLQTWFLKAGIVAEEVRPECSVLTSLPSLFK